MYVCKKQLQPMVDSEDEDAVRAAKEAEEAANHANLSSKREQEEKK